MSTAFSHLQKLLPQHRLSRLAGKLADSRRDWVRRSLIRSFAAFYDISLAEALREDLDDYVSFNDFFTRVLKPDARPMPADPATIVSPADGTLSQFGEIQHDMLYQAKGKHYSLDALLGADPIAGKLDGGWFSTIYLAPSDYHRVHMPLEGRLLRYHAVPGELFSVNALTAEGITDLFCRNERLVCIFDTALGEVAMVLVGAMIVASIETVWGEPRSPYREYCSVDLSNATDPGSLKFTRGQEMGRFLLGSTVILCLPRGKFSASESLAEGHSIRLGSPIGRIG